MNDLAQVLAGKRILVTAQRRSAELAEALERRGASVAVTPVLGVESRVDDQALINCTRVIVESGIDALVVTTAIGFRTWLETVEGVGLRTDLLAALESSRLIARGQKARGALQAAGLAATWVAESETSLEILEFLLADSVAGQRIAVQHHGGGDAAFERRLREAGADVLPLAVYRWGPAPDPAAVTKACRDVAAGDYDAVLFTSAPAVSAFLAEVDALGLSEAVRARSAGGLTVAAVGPTTASPLETAGVSAIYPDRSRMGALVRLVIAEVGGR